MIEPHNEIVCVYVVVRNFDVEWSSSQPTSHLSEHLVGGGITTLVIRAISLPPLVVRGHFKAFWSATFIRNGTAPLDAVVVLRSRRRDDNGQLETGLSARLGGKMDESGWCFAADDYDDGIRHLQATVLPVRWLWEF